MLRKIKSRLVNWLLKDVRVERMWIKELRVGNKTINIFGDRIRLPGLSSDPANLAAGDMWFRSDLGRPRWFDGSATKEVSDITPEDVWSHPNRTLTEYKVTTEVIKNKDYDHARPEDYYYAALVQILGRVTADEHASFIDGAIDLNPDKMIDFYARLISNNPWNIWTDDVVAEIFNSANLAASKAASILNSSVITADKAASILNQAKLGVSRAASILNDSSLALSKAADIIASSNITESRVADIFNDSNIAASRIKDIIAHDNVSADKAQSILYTMVDKGYYDRILEIVTCDADDATISSNTTLSSGVNRYKNLTIDSGVTLTVGASPGVIVADKITNNGVIKSGWVKGAGGSGKTGGGDGGGGAGAVIVLARTIDPGGTVNADGLPGGNGPSESSGTQNTAAIGEDGEYWVIGDDTPGTGGSGGASSQKNGGAGNPSGGGGGGGYASDGAAGGGSVLTTFSSGQDIIVELFKALVDWWLQNVVGKTPTSTKSFPSLGGSGGGEGGDSYNAPDYNGGGGGGGAGEVIIYGISIGDITVYARGGAGGSAPSYAGGGGGGGGGIVYLFYKSSIGSYTIDVSGGAGGSGGHANGSSGSSGSYRVIQL